MNLESSFDREPLPSEKRIFDMEAAAAVIIDENEDAEDGNSIDPERQKILVQMVDDFFALIKQHQKVLSERIKTTERMMTGGSVVLSLVHIFANQVAVALSVVASAIHFIAHASNEQIALAIFSKEIDSAQERLQTHIGNMNALLREKDIDAICIFLQNVIICSENAEGELVIDLDKTIECHPFLETSKEY